jgi:hypothetical protein
VPPQGIALRTGLFRLDWTLRFPWGEHFFPLKSGCHQLQVSYPYLRLSQAERASTLVDVASNEVRASYRAPRSVLVAFSPGKLTVEPRDQS